MIKFFRRIRHKLLNEGNFRKYLIYSIGEIFLVVVGILIALQINTRVIWNQDRKMEIEYLTALSYELEKDTSVYKWIVESLSSQHNAFRNVIRVVENPQDVILDSLQFINNFRNNGYATIIKGNSFTWKELQATGQISLIRDRDLTRKLFEYYDLSERFASEYNEFPLEQRLIVREITNGIFNLDESDEYFDDWRHDKVPRQEAFEFVRTDKKLLIHMKSIYISSQVQMKQGERNIVLAKEVLNSIKMKINN